MAAKKKAPARSPAKISAGTKAIRGMYGAYNITDGKTTKITDKNAASFMESQFNTPGSLNYRPPGGTGLTPFANKMGARMGKYDAATGQFLVKGSKQARRPRKDVGGPLGAAGGTAMEDVTGASIASTGQYAEGDSTRTGTAAAQGKAYEYAFGTDAGTVLHSGDYVPSSAQTAAGASTGGGGKPKKPKKGGKKKLGKKPTAAQRKKRAS